MVEGKLEGMVRYAVLFSKDANSPNASMEIKDDREFMVWLRTNGINYETESISKRRFILYVPEDRVELLNEQRKQISHRNDSQRMIDYIHLAGR